MNTLPSFVRTAFQHYERRNAGADDYSRYKALESIYATTIKYVGTVFALIAADHGPDMKEAVWRCIFRSSSLGGWLDAVEKVCQNQKTFSEPVSRYCATYSDYTKHPAKSNLDLIATQYNIIADRLTRNGYRFDVADLKSLSLRRALMFIVMLRNKCAHGALDSPFFHGIEAPMFAALKLILDLIPFSQCVFWGKYGRAALQMVEVPKQQVSRHNYIFWAESDLLSYGYTDSIPFMVYREESRQIFLLNSAVSENDPTAEYIEHDCGTVIYREVDQSWDQGPTSPSRDLRPRNYEQHVDVLSRTDVAWREVPLTSSAVESASDEVGIYVFTTDVRVGHLEMEVVLYVGKTTNFKERLRNYVKILKGYETRPGISDMFRVYGSSVKLRFASTAGVTIAKIERAIYETTMPEFNLIAPSKG